MTDVPDRVSNREEETCCVNRFIYTFICEGKLLIEEQEVLKGKKLVLSRRHHLIL
jgi:hypothetical protein